MILLKQLVDTNKVTVYSLGFFTCKISINFSNDHYISKENIFNDEIGYTIKSIMIGLMIVWLLTLKKKYLKC